MLKVIGLLVGLSLRGTDFLLTNTLDLTLEIIKFEVHRHQTG